MAKPVIKTELFSKMAEIEIGGVEKNYKGLAMHALKGLHEHIGELVAKVFSQSSNLLDLAAGSGALSLRLTDMGHNVTACDYVTENFRLKDTIDFRKVDLNTEFSRELGGMFDGVLAVEIIEHLENPRHVIREIFASLKPGGVLMLSTPNIDNPVSLAFFVRLGWFQWFGDENYKNDGHITPISQQSLRQFFQEAGFVELEIDSFGDPFRATEGWPKMRLFAKLLGLLSSRKNRPQGEILIAIGRKPL